MTGPSQQVEYTPIPHKVNHYKITIMYPQPIKHYTYLNIPFANNFNHTHKSNAGKVNFIKGINEKLHSYNIIGTGVHPHTHYCKS